MKPKTKNWTPKFIALAVVCLVIGVGIGLLGYHYFFKSETVSNWPSTKIEPTKEMVKKIIIYDSKQKGFATVFNTPIKSEEGIGLASLLTRKLHELNLQATCVFSEEDIYEIIHKDRVAELIFKEPIDITISQWVEPEERYHIPIEEKGYRILENVKTALFILEDRQDEGLEAYILVGAEREDKDEKCSWEITQEDLEKLGPCEGSVGYIFSEEYGCSTLFGCEFDPEIVPFKTQGECELACGRMWSCWAINIKEEGKPELDKTWIDGINKILTEEIPSQLCIEEGGRGYWGEDECCSGLTSLSRWTICDTPGDKRGCNENGCFPPPPDGSFICTKCGDKICGLGENRCNCPKDCSEEIYPEDVKFTYFDDREKINNTAGFLIQIYEPKPFQSMLLTGEQIQILKDSGVRVMQSSEIEYVYHSLIEEDKVDEVKNLDFVKDVYPYKTKLIARG